MEKIYNAPQVKVKVVDVSVFRKKHYKQRNPSFKNPITDSTILYSHRKMVTTKYMDSVPLKISSNECSTIHDGKTY
jgi:hypothetical protein